MHCMLSLLCFLLTQPIDAREEHVALRDRRGVAEYIRAGIGASTAQIGSTSSAGLLASTSGILNAGNLSELATCAASWSSYSIEATSNIGFTAVTYRAATLINTTVVYGTGDVYTSYGKIPVASGEFTPTRTVGRLFNVSTTTSSFISTTSNLALVTQTPACSFSPKDCSRLYVSYISSLSLPFNASVPKITPSPENSPRCPDYYYKPFTTEYASTVSVTEDCKLYGNSVELFYFPSRTAGEPEPTAPITYVYKKGTTFTSPSIYLSFDYLSATRYIPGSIASYSASCGIDGCTTQAVAPADAIDYEGTVISGQIISLAPTDVSSIVLKYDSAKASELISTVAGNLKGYGDVSPDIHLGAILSESLTAEPLRIEDLVHPPPRAYYLRPEGAPGCDSLIHKPECGTIFEGAYRAIISLPSEVSGLQGAWKTCNPAIYGVYDPPIALTEASAAAKPTGVGNAPPAYTTSVPTKASPYTITPPLATAARTALRDTLPSATDGRESTLLLPSAQPSHGSNENGATPDASSGGDQSGAPSNTDGTGDGTALIPTRTSGGSNSDGEHSSGQDLSGTRTSASNDDDSSTAASDRGSGKQGSTASGGSAATHRSGSREPTDTSSGPSSSNSAQSGASIKMVLSLVHWALLLGPIIVALAS